MYHFGLLDPDPKHWEKRLHHSKVERIFTKYPYPTREIDVCEAGQKVVLVRLKCGLLAQEAQEAVSLGGRPAPVPGVHAQLLSPALAPQGGGHRAIQVSGTGGGGRDE